MFKNEETEDTEYESIQEEEELEEDEMFNWSDCFRFEWWQILLLMCLIVFLCTPILVQNTRTPKYEIRINFEPQPSPPTPIPKKKEVPVFDESSWLCPAQGIDIQGAKIKLKRLIEEESPEYNASKWKCPQGRRGLMSPLPKGMEFIRDTPGLLYERCSSLNATCDLNVAIDMALERLRKEFPIDPVDPMLSLGPFGHNHAYQVDYCHRKIEEYCIPLYSLPPCGIVEELVDYGHELVRVPCHKVERLFGAYGPPAALSGTQCDVFLRERGL